MNVEIELFPLKKLPGVKFDVSKFYADLIAVDPEDVNRASTKINELGARLRQKEFKKRVLGRCDFHLAPEFKIGIKL
jgi:hypothetical protein